MIHAKTAVADGVWSRVGSSNLNLASLLGNWELDVAILDRDVAAMMEELFLKDMGSAVEVTLRPPGTPRIGGRALQRLPVKEAGDPDPQRSLLSAREARRKAPRGSRVGRVLGQISRAAVVLGRALIGQRIVGREDSGWIAIIALVLLGGAALGVAEPRLLAWPISFILFWLGVASLFRAWRK